MRQLIVTVRAAADAQVKTTQNGKQYMEFRCANNEYDFAKKETNTFWLRAVSFTPQHLNLAQFIKKGSSLILSGDYTNNIYNRNDGSQEIDNTLIIHSVAFNDTRANSDTKQTTTTAATPAPTMEIKNPTIEPKPATQPEVATTEDDDLPF